MKTIPLTHGKFAKVSDCDYQYLSQFHWYLHSEGYAVRDVYGDGKKKTIRMHREIAKTPPGMDTDHIDRDRLNNQRENLRTCTRSENLRNSTKRTGSMFKGVSFFKPTKKWRASINLNKRQHHLGYFNDPVSAAKAYNQAAMELFGSFACLNDIKESL